jgi:hypothetical protein
MKIIKELRMKKTTAQDSKLIAKCKQSVKKQYPNAHLHLMSNGYYTIVEEQDDLTIKDILADHCLMYSKNPTEVWQLAQLASKVTQNINRTHPLRIEGVDLEAKLARIEQRRLNGVISKENRKINDLDIY